MSRLPERERGRSGGYEIGSARQRDLMPPPLRCEACGYQPAHTAAAPNGRDVSAVHAARAHHRGAKVRRMLSVGRSRVYELIARGDLASVKIGASRRVTIKSIRKLLADATEPPQRARRAATSLKLGARRMIPSASVAKLVAGAR